MYEVHDYIKSYLGESKAAHDFAKQFLERRQKLKPPSQQVRILASFVVSVVFYLVGGAFIFYSSLELALIPR